MPVTATSGSDRAAAPAAVAVVPLPDGSAVLGEMIPGDGARVASAVRHHDLASAVADRERAGPVRWVWAATAGCYPGLLAAGVRVARCHDVALVEALLLGRDGRQGEPATLAAAWARLRGDPVPPRRPGWPGGSAGAQQALFDVDVGELGGGGLGGAWPRDDTPSEDRRDSGGPGEDQLISGASGPGGDGPGGNRPGGGAPGGDGPVGQPGGDGLVADLAAGGGAPGGDGPGGDGPGAGAPGKGGPVADLAAGGAPGGAGLGGGAPGRGGPDGGAPHAGAAAAEVPPGAGVVLAALAAVYADQLARIAADPAPRRLRLLAAAESAGALAAAEMSFEGLPWRPDVHDELLAGLLGPRPARGYRPQRLAELATRITEAFGGRPVNPDSPAQLLRAFAAEGISVPSTRSQVLSGVDHPAVPLLLEYKELARLHAAHGWGWLDTWVAGGRFRPEYVVGGVVSGRWATNGGGALQIPRLLRRAVIADPGWILVSGDAAQLEPRVLAALAGDRAFAEAAAAGDLYAELAGAFGGERGKAKVALLSAMYGGAGGEAGQLLAVLRRRFPRAAEYVEAAARAGEEGRVVRSVLGRTCPPPSAAWRSLAARAGDPAAARSVRARGRFTRNFVVQASAADWALVLLACLRPRLAAFGIKKGLTDSAGVPGRPHLVFFQHDEVIVHCPEELAGQVVGAVAAAATEAGRLVFGATPVRFPVTTAVVSCYADAK